MYEVVSILFVNGISVFRAYYQWKLSRSFIRLMSSIRMKPASRDLFASVYTTLLFMGNYLMNI